MPESNLPKVFLVVTIPTHLRVMMDAADLLDASGRYAPQMIYYPSAVFEQNHQDCANSRHEAFIWKESGKFFRAHHALDKRGDGQAQPAMGEKRPNAISEVSHPAPTAQREPTLARLLRILPHNGTYTRLRQKIPFLPPQSLLLDLVHWIWARLRFCVTLARKSAILTIRFLSTVYWLLRTFSQILSDALKRRSPTNAKSSRRHPLLQRLLFAAFSEKWNQPLPQSSTADYSFTHKVSNAFNDGIFVGLQDQKIFVQGFSELLEQEKPALVILPEENLFYYSHLIVDAAHNRNIPCAVVPFTIVNTLEWAEAFHDISQYHAEKGWNRIFALAFPRWVLKHRDRRLILPPVFIMVCEYLGIVPDQPWVISSGPANAIAAESQFMCDYYLRAGIRSEKIRLTGTTADDKLYALLQSRDAQRKMLAERSAIDIQGKVILIALPPDQFPGGKRPGCEFDGYDELIRFMVNTISASCAEKNTVLINLHPRINRANVAYLESLGAIIIAEPIEQLVPLADIYVAVVSATIRLAISCGIPVVNYDAYQYNYDDYNNLPGVCEVKTRDAYANTVTSLLHDDAFFSKIQSAQQDTARHLSTIDGRAGSRLLGLFDELVRVNH